MLLYSSTGHSRLWQALCRSPQHSKGYLQNHTHWYACSADLNWPRVKQEASTDKGSVCWQRVQLSRTPRWYLAYSGGMNEGDELPIRIVAAAQLSCAKAAQLSLKMQPKHSPSTHTEGQHKPVQQSTTSHKASKQDCQHYINIAKCHHLGDRGQT